MALPTKEELQNIFIDFNIKKIKASIAIELEIPDMSNEVLDQVSDCEDYIQSKYPNFIYDLHLKPIVDTSKLE
jgi:hypothetical protein